MLPLSSFEAQVQTLVEQAYRNLLIEQRRRIRLISVANQLNQLQTAFASNYLYFPNVPYGVTLQNIVYVTLIVLIQAEKEGQLKESSSSMFVVKELTLLLQVFSI
jgi:hypothetical protein